MDVHFAKVKTLYIKTSLLKKKILLAINWAHRRSKFEGWGCCWSTYLKTCVKAVACHGLSLLLARHTRCSSQRLKLTGILESFQTKEYLDLTFHYTALFSRLESALGIISTAQYCRVLVCMGALGAAAPTDFQKGWFCTQRFLGKDDFYT